MMRHWWIRRLRISRQTIGYRFSSRRRKCVVLPCMRMPDITPSRLWVRRVFFVYWVILAALTHLPRLPRAASGALDHDKVVHTIAYWILAALAWWSWPPSGAGKVLQRAMMWLVILAVYAATDELLQPLTDRNCELGDWIADFVGIVLGLGTAYAVGHRRR